MGSSGMDFSLGVADAVLLRLLRDRCQESLATNAGSGGTVLVDGIMHKEAMMLNAKRA